MCINTKPNTWGCQALKSVFWGGWLQSQDTEWVAGTQQWVGEWKSQQGWSQGL